MFSMTFKVSFRKKSNKNRNNVKIVIISVDEIIWHIKFEMEESQYLEFQIIPTKLP